MSKLRVQITLGGYEAYLDVDIRGDESVAERLTTAVLEILKEALEVQTNE